MEPGTSTLNLFTNRDHRIGKAVSQLSLASTSAHTAGIDNAGFERGPNDDENGNAVTEKRKTFPLSSYGGNLVKPMASRSVSTIDIRPQISYRTRLKEAAKQERSRKEKHQNRMRLNNLKTYLNSAFWIACFGGTLSLPCAMILIGGIFLRSCPAMPALPWLLMFGGLLVTLGNMLNLVNQFWSDLRLPRIDDGLRKSIVSAANLGLNSLVCCSFIFGSLFIYGSSRPSSSSVNPVVTENHDPPASNDPAQQYQLSYCHAVIYSFTFWLINLIWIYIGFATILVLVAYLSATMLI